MNKIEKLIYKIIDKIVKISFQNYKFNKRFVSPPVHTYGDFILNLEYFLLKKKEQNNDYIYLTVKSFPANKLLPFFFKNNNSVYKFYDEKIFLITKFIFENIYYFYNKIFKKNKKNYLLQLNQRMLNQLQKKSEIKFYENRQRVEPNKRNKILSSNLKNNNLLLRKYLYILKNEYNYPSINELIRLRNNLNCQLDDEDLFSDTYKAELFKSLKINKKYICLFLRPYFQNFEKKKVNIELDPRSTNDVRTFKPLVNYLKKLNFDIVIVGKNSKNKELSEFGAIDYSSSSYQSITNDMYIYKYSEFMVANPGGPSVYPWIFDKPCLALNATTFSSFPNWDKYIYHPKKIINKNGNKQLNFDEIIANPIIYEQGIKSYNSQNLITEDLNEEELIESLKYFLMMYENKNYEQDLSRYRTMYEKLSFYHLGLKESFNRISERYLYYLKNL